MSAVRGKPDADPTWRCSQQTAVSSSSGRLVEGNCPNLNLAATELAILTSAEPSSGSTVGSITAHPGNYW
jgi:hypothetical protein